MSPKEDPTASELLWGIRADCEFLSNAALYGTIQEDPLWHDLSAARNVLRRARAFVELRLARAALASATDRVSRVPCDHCQRSCDECPKDDRSP